MNILITGSPGVGKTTIGLLLKEKGYGFIDIDRTKNLKYWFNIKTRKRIDFQGKKDLDWYELHDLNWDREVLKKILSEHKEKMVFVSGVTSNFTDDFDLFDKIFLLKSNINTLRNRRIGRRSKDSQIDMKEIEQDFEEHDEFQKNMIKHGSISIDAGQKPEVIVKTIIESIKKQ